MREGKSDEVEQKGCFCRDMNLNLGCTTCRSGPSAITHGQRSLVSGAIRNTLHYVQYVYGDKC
jgi:hypothetical protein